MRLRALSFAILGAASLAAGCASSGIKASDFPASSPQVALRPYYASISDADLPVAPATPKLDLSAPITRVMVASCIDEEIEAPTLKPMLSDAADVTLLIGDNGYGDMDGRWYVNNDPLLEELRESYRELGANPDFAALRAVRPMLTVWDDHDYGVNDGGGDFPFKEFAERIYERFWSLEDRALAKRPGVYDSFIAGPEGQRLQVIMLDTRFFRSPLKKTDQYGAMGKERYVPSDDPYQSMLGEAQWAWLAAELKKPADLRLLVSSIQITPNVHGWEAWATLPIERERLYALLSETEAVSNTVFVSGDRHASYLYANTEAAEVPVREMTTSSINKSFAKQEIPSEHDPMEIGRGFTPVNYGMVEVDWAGRSVSLQIKDEAGQIRRSTKFAF